MKTQFIKYYTTGNIKVVPKKCKTRIKVVLKKCKIYVKVVAKKCKSY